MNKIVKGLMIAGTLGASLMAFTRTADAKDKDGNIVIVIDPGHGGEDPGSLATTGATESKCNYAIAEVMKKELSKCEGISDKGRRYMDDQYGTSYDCCRPQCGFSHKHS